MTGSASSTGAAGALTRGSLPRSGPLWEMPRPTPGSTSPPVPIPADCTDGFNAVYWRRPAAYLDPEIWRPMSALALIPSPDRQAGMRRLRDDLNSGDWQRRWGQLLALDELDLGYRVVATRP